MTKRRTHKEIAEAAVRNAQRLEHVNAWLRGVNWDYWDIKSTQIAGIGGYLLGIWMKRKSDGYAILAQEGYMPRLIEAGWQSTGQWPSEDEATAWLALRDRVQAQEGSAR